VRELRHLLDKVLEAILQRAPVGSYMGLFLGGEGGQGMLPNILRVVRERIEGAWGASGCQPSRASPRAGVCTLVCTRYGSLPVACGTSWQTSRGARSWHARWVDARKCQ
jgi:hypothetical protein